MTKSKGLVTTNARRRRAKQLPVDINRCGDPEKNAMLQRVDALIARCEASLMKAAKRPRRAGRRVEFKPDWAIPPGETIIDCLEFRRMTQREFAQRVGRPEEQVSRLIHGRIALSARWALGLEKVLGAPARFWMNLEANYRRALAQKQAR